MNSLHLEIATPDGLVFSGKVASVLLPGWEGELGILPGHMPLLVSLKRGELGYRIDEIEQRLAISHGFAEITGTHVSVLIDAAIASSHLSEIEIEEALNRIEPMMPKLGLLHDSDPKL